MSVVKMKKFVGVDDPERGGFLLVDKRKGISSFMAVREARKELGTRRVGHSGTLDPLATGLLVLAFGRATKFLEYLLGLPKVYEVEAQFGAVSDTYDAEGKIKEVDNDVMIEKKVLERVIEGSFVGKIVQVPPKYSALKINGKRACDLVRGGEEVEMKGREVFVESFEVLEVEGSVAKFRVHCSKGTYIRSLVHDLGEVLGCGAYVKELRRTAVGPFEVEECGGGSLELEVLDRVMEGLELKEEEFERLRNGQKIEMQKAPGRKLALYQGKVVGVVEEG